MTKEKTIWDRTISGKPDDGAICSRTRTTTHADVERFAEMTGDRHQFSQPHDPPRSRRLQARRIETKGKGQPRVKSDRCNKAAGASDALWFISRGVVADELAVGSLVAVKLASPLLSRPVGISVARWAPINVERSVFAECLPHAVRRG
jgi:hypothetical protein